jgi:hypothetical protein
VNKHSQLKLLALGLLFVLAFPFSAGAQSSGLTVRLSRTFGIATGGEIQGVFTIRTSGPEDLRRVVFYIDDQVIGEQTSAPFSQRFNTDAFPVGQHTIRAVGYTIDNQELSSNVLRIEFVGMVQALAGSLKVVGPIVVIVLLGYLFTAVWPNLQRKKSGGTTRIRNYGPLGGTICPKCNRPFGVHIWGVNLLVGRLDCCPHCGRWSLVRRMPTYMLQSAEEAEDELLEQQPASFTPVGEERTRKELEESRYQDL